MQVVLLRGGPAAGLLPTRRPGAGVRSLLAADPHLRRWRRDDDEAGVSARAGGGGGKGWLGGLPSWPNRDESSKQEEEEEEDVANDPSMKPINEVLGGGVNDSDTDDDDDGDGGGPGPLGPLAALVVGLTAEELATFRTALHAIDADIVRLIPCPRAALEPGAAGLALEDAVALELCPQHEPAPEGTPPVVFLSGMSGPEVAEMVRCYREDPEPPLPPAAFCALVPGNRRRKVAELVKSIWLDEAKVREKWRLRQQQQQQQQQQQEA
jgi:hypothetical protein